METKSWRTIRINDHANGERQESGRLTVQEVSIREHTLACGVMRREDGVHDTEGK